ncbi:helix-turn-helix transcriptional regulator [Pseudomonas citronellolis]|uniref:helix-turn-helix transcriptional regulator n=1 Tax=Pseudomonas citronellolis TaxID=53408 RepID=UPI003C2E5874
MLSISRSCIYDWLNPRSPRYDASFPKQIRLSGKANGGAVGWSVASIHKWLESRSWIDNV